MNVLEEFAVSLGWVIDKSSQDRAKKAIAEVDAAVDRGVAREAAATREISRHHRLRAESSEKMGREIGLALTQHIGGTLRTLTGLAAGLGAAIGTVQAFTQQVVELKNLNDEAKRAGTSVPNLRALGQTFTQLGSSAAEASGSINGIAQALRENRGNRSFLQSLGLTPDDLKDTTTSLDKLSAFLRTLESDTALLYGKLVGLGDEQVRILRDPNFSQMLRENQKLQKETGDLADANAAKAKQLVNAWDELTQRVDNMKKRLVGELIPALLPFVEGLNTFLKENSATFRQVIDDLNAVLPKLSSADVKAFFGEMVERLKTTRMEAQALVDVLAKISGAVSGAATEALKAHPLNPTGEVGPVAAFPGKLDDAADKQLQAAKKFEESVAEDKRTKEQTGGLWSRFSSWIGNMTGFGGGAGGGAGGGGAGGPSIGTGLGGLGPAGRGAGGLPGGPKGGPVASGGPLAQRRAEAMRVAMDQLRKEGVPEASLRGAAAQLVGNAEMESGLDPTKSHDQGTGYGLYGARDPSPGRGRKTNMLNWLAQHGYAKDSFEGQMRYMAHDALTGGYGRTRDTLMRGGTSPADVYNVTKDFESPAIVNDRNAAVRAALGANTAAGAQVQDQGLKANLAALNAVTAGARESGQVVTSGYRGPNHPLTRANPSSAHAQGRAYDLRARTPEQADAAMASERERLGRLGLTENADFIFKDEVRHSVAWGRGKHLHVSLTPSGVAKVNAQQGGGMAGAAEGLMKNANALIGDRSQAIQVGQNAAAAQAPGKALSDAQAPIASPSSTDNSRTVTQNMEFNANITATDPHAAAGAFRRASEINSGLAISGLKGAIR